MSCGSLFIRTTTTGLIGLNFKRSLTRWSRVTSSHNIDLPGHDYAVCPFCAYLRGERPYAIVARGELVAVMVTQEQRGTPHLLVVPMRHRETIIDLDDEEARHAIIVTREVARVIDAEFRRPGVAIWQNNGVSAHQAIRHVHFHVAGTLDQGGTDWGPVEETSLEDAETVALSFRPRITKVLLGL
ncbi:HIT family protein [Baekduia sp. Peel2402]|uniref:HIT family protein n=1 Tax=Baekduia sp. Peel2402 TaxID=3458296 RepID=UPI00403EB74E